jgi:hypothetical protein
MLNFLTVVILNEARDLLSRGVHPKQALRFAQDDKLRIREKSCLVPTK